MRSTGAAMAHGGRDNGAPGNGRTTRVLRGVRARSGWEQYRGGLPGFGGADGGVGGNSVLSDSSYEFMKVPMENSVEQYESKPDGKNR